MFLRVVDSWTVIQLVPSPQRMLADLLHLPQAISIMGSPIPADLNITKVRRTRTMMTAISSTEDSALSLETMVIDLETNVGMTKARAAKSTSICGIVRISNA